MTDPYQAPGPVLPDDLLEEKPEFAKAMDAMAKASQAKTVFNFLEDYLVGRQRQLDQQLFHSIGSQDPPEKLLRICYEKHEVHRFLRNLEALIKVGVGAARVLQPMMDSQI